MGYIWVIAHLLTIDPNFQRDIQVAQPWPTLEVQDQFNQRIFFRMIHVKDSRTYQGETFGRLGLSGYFFFTYLPQHQYVNVNAPIGYKLGGTGVVWVWGSYYWGVLEFPLNS